MSALLLALALAAPCDLAEVAHVAPAQQGAACALLSRPAEAPLEVGRVGPIYDEPGFERARLRNTGAWKALLAQLQRWFNQLAETSGAQTYSNVTRVLVLVAALVLGGLVVLRTLGRRRAAPGPPGPASPVAASLELEDPAHHLARADALLGAQPREAVREALLALLSFLERQRYARPDRVKTNQELARELSTRGAPAALVQELAPLLGWFDRAYYSLEAVPAADARRFVADVRRVAGSTA